MQTKQFHVIPNTLFPCLPTPSPTSRPLHHQPSASADTQSSTLLRSRCPNHLNLPRLTTSATQLIPRRLYKSSLLSDIKYSRGGCYVINRWKKLEMKRMGPRTNPWSTQLLGIVVMGIELVIPLFEKMSLFTRSITCTCFQQNSDAKSCQICQILDTWLMVWI